MKRTIILLISAVSIISLVACTAPPKSNVSSQPTPTPKPTPAPFDIAEYKNLVSECNDDIMNDSILLSNMGNYEYNYWRSLSKLGGTLNYDRMVSAAQEWLAKNSEVTFETIEQNYDTIGRKYKDITAIDASGAEAEKIKETFEKLFDSYNKLYLLVTSPSGGISDFANNFNEYQDDIKNHNSILSRLVSDQ